MAQPPLPLIGFLRRCENDETYTRYSPSLHLVLRGKMYEIQNTQNSF